MKYPVNTFLFKNEYKLVGNWQIKFECSENSKNSKVVVTQFINTLKKNSTQI